MEVREAEVCAALDQALARGRGIRAGDEDEAAVGLGVGVGARRRPFRQTAAHEGLQLVDDGQQPLRGEGRVVHVVQVQVHREGAFPRRDLAEVQRPRLGHVPLQELRPQLRRHAECARGMLLGLHRQVRVGAARAPEALLLGKPV